MGEKKQKTSEEWKKELTPEQYKVMREGGTERPFTGEHVYTKDKGTYVCAACGQELFGSNTKFDSGTGWPSFTEPKNVEHVELRDDSSHGLKRTEVVCKNCDSHLGHVFDDGPDGKQRYCINSVCLDLQKE